MITLTPEQASALEQIRQFLNGPGKVFILSGYAGTGKTTLVREILRMTDESPYHVKLMAPTGRAAKVLREKTGAEARTIHSSIFKLSQIEIRETDELSSLRIPLYFPLNEEEGLQRKSLCIVDEASMVSSRDQSREDLSFGCGILLKDLMRFVCLNSGSKIIFTGDPAQLPPVGDNRSNALSREWFEEQGYPVQACGLTHIIRQGKESLILSNSMKIRDLLEKDSRTELTFDRKAGEVEAMDMNQVVEAYSDAFGNGESSVVVTYSNTSALSYNRMIRSRYYGDGIPKLVEGDRLMVVANNYSGETELFNGDYLTLVRLTGSPETVTIPVSRKMDDPQQSTLKRDIPLEFVDAELQMEDGSLIRRKLLTAILDTNDSSLTPFQHQALYIYFIMRHPGAAKDRDTLSELLHEDPYFNAVQVKYGYAITGHKSQGGEWDRVFVDYQGRTGLNDDCLRWMYTATTRARKTLYGVNMPAITPLTKFTFIPEITKVSKAPADFYPADALVQETPYHPAGTHPALLAEYWAVCEVLADTDHHIDKVTSFNWQEVYTIDEVRYAVYYDGSHTFGKFRCMDNADEALLELLNSVTLYLPYSYTPQDRTLEILHSQMLVIAMSLHITISNVSCSPYKVRYHLITRPGVFAYVDFHYNAKGMLTKGQLFSSLGNDDEILKNLIKLF